MIDYADMTDAIEVVSNPPRMRVRVNVTKNTRGYSYDSTVEVEWDNSTDASSGYVVTSPTVNGTEESQSVGIVIRDLLQVADREAREEIRRRELLDGTGA